MKINKIFYRAQQNLANDDRNHGCQIAMLLKRTNLYPIDELSTVASSRISIKRCAHLDRAVEDRYLDYFLVYHSILLREKNELCRNIGFSCQKRP